MRSLVRALLPPFSVVSDASPAPATARSKLDPGRSRGFLEQQSQGASFGVSHTSTRAGRYGHAAGQQRPAGGWLLGPYLLALHSRLVALFRVARKAPGFAWGPSPVSGQRKAPSSLCATRGPAGGGQRVSRYNSRATTSTATSSRTRSRQRPRQSSSGSSGVVTRRPRCRPRPWRGPRSGCECRGHRGVLRQAVALPQCAGRPPGD